MPELPDVTIYVERLSALVVGEPLERLRIASPFVLRTVSPSPRELEGSKVLSVRRMAKRIVLGFEEGRYAAIHLMRAGRLHWKEKGAKVPAKVGLAAFDFPRGTLLFTEAGTKKRASLHLVAGEEGLRALDRGGLEVLGSTLAAFRATLTRENHTLKRALTDPGLFSGIGNAYSDEILHRAKLSPVRLTQQLDDADVETLWRATQDTLEDWTARLRREVGDGFPEKVTAFREGMAVHGRYGKPCPVCGSPVQRIVYAENETNYCARCQTGGKLLADRALSRLLRGDWPRSLDELEERKSGGA